MREYPDIQYTPPLEDDHLKLLESKHITKKLVLLGDSAVGKTSLIRRYVIDIFDDKYIATIGTKVTKKEIKYKLSDRAIYLTMMLWDILGQKDYRKVRTTGFKGANGAILVGDLTRPGSITNIVDFWLPALEEVVDDVPSILIGNKYDLLSNGIEAIDLLASVSTETSSPYFICSAKTGDNVENAFCAIGELMLRDDIGSAQGGHRADDMYSLAMTVDAIISDFCEQYQDIPKGMEILEKVFAKAGVDVNAPSKESMLECLELISEVEKDHLGREVAEVNKLRRWRLLEEASPSRED